MTERLTRTSVAFRKAFRLPGVEAEQPAGNYSVLTIEEQIESLSFIAYRRLSTTIALGRDIAGMRAEQTTWIDPEDLKDALARDAEAPHVPV